MNIEPLEYIYDSIDYWRFLIIGQHAERKLLPNVWIKNTRVKT